MPPSGLTVAIVICALAHTSLTYSLCPEACTCGQDEHGQLSTRCITGNMHLIPVEEINHKSEVVIISAPDDLHPNMLTVGPIFTQPKPFTKLEELHIVNSNVPSIGQFSFWGLKNLRVLNLTRNNLTSIVPDNFRGLLNLTDLYLDNNIISEMPSETFRYLSELRVLSMSENRITTLVPRLFRMLAKLYYLNLSSNPLTELNPEVFKDIQYVRIFKCRRCHIKRVNPQIYHLLPNLEELDMGNNLFKYLTSDEFISLKKLKILWLDKNQLSVIVDNMFSHQQSLHTLSIAHNRLALLTQRAFTNLSSLMLLDISYNKLDRFHLETFGPVIESLKHIDFSGNNLPLKEIAIVLQMFPEIHGVGVANLSIKDLPDNFFAYNRHITDLDLSWNNFEVFPDELLSRVKFVQRLDISRNKLQGLSERSLTRLWAIPHIEISDNPWNCEKCDISMMLSYMLTTVLNSTIQSLVCQTPKHLRGVAIGELVDVTLNWCSSNSIQHASEGGGITDEGRLSIVAGLLLIFFVVISAITAGICYSKRRTAEYYTNEEKRRSTSERVFDNQLVYFCETDDAHNCKIPMYEIKEKEEILVEGRSVATIHTPYQIISKGS